MWAATPRPASVEGLTLNSKKERPSESMFSRCAAAARVARNFLAILGAGAAAREPSFAPRGFAPRGGGCALKKIGPGGVRPAPTPLERTAFHSRNVEPKKRIEGGQGSGTSCRRGCTRSDGSCPSRARRRSTPASMIVSKTLTNRAGSDASSSSVQPTRCTAALATTLMRRMTPSGRGRSQSEAPACNTRSTGCTRGSSIEAALWGARATAAAPASPLTKPLPPA